MGLIQNIKDICVMKSCIIKKCNTVGLHCDEVMESNVTENKAKQTFSHTLFPSLFHIHKYITHRHVAMWEAWSWIAAL